MRWLENLAKGIVVLDLDDTGSGDTNASAGAYNPRKYSDRKFSPDTLRGRF
jgi:hypothetical protein